MTDREFSWKGAFILKQKAKATSLPICCIVSMWVFILKRFPSENESDVAFTS